MRACPAGAVHEQLDGGRAEPATDLDVAFAALVDRRDRDACPSDLSHEEVGDVDEGVVGVTSADLLEHLVLVLELFERGAHIGHVAADGDDRIPVRVVQVVLQVELDDARQTVGRAEPHLAGAGRTGLADEVAPGVPDLGLVAGIHEVEEHPVAPHLGGVADRDAVLHGAAEDATVLVEERHVLAQVPQGGMIEQGVQGHGLSRIGID